MKPMILKDKKIKSVEQENKTNKTPNRTFNTILQNNIDTETSTNQLKSGVLMKEKEHHIPRKDTYITNEKELEIWSLFRSIFDKDR